MNIDNKKATGFTLIEVLVGTFIFSIVAIAIYGSYTSLIRLANSSQARTGAVQLAAEQFEIIRNMPYSDIGLTNGIPLGILPQNQTLTRGGTDYNVLLTIRNVNLATSSVQASEKLVQIEVDCPSCINFEPVVLTGQVAPANLQSAADGGALTVQVFNGNGEPVPGATVFVQSVATSSIQNTDVTNNSGILNIIGIPQGINTYKIVVSKDGYSTEQTYPLGAIANPNPTRPHMTVLNQQVSQSSFAIDLLSSLQFSSVSPLCSPVGNIDFTMTGAKNIGINVPKYSQELSTNSSGVLDVTNLEWDTYTIVPTNSSYDIAGINPDSPFSLNPNNVQSVQLVVVPTNPSSLMVSVLDNATKLPISGATVQLTRSGYNVTKITGQGYLSQTDWSSGSGQDMFVNQSQYYTDNSLVDVATSSGDVVLREIFGLFDTNATGTLLSSIFDTGTSSNFHNLVWTPNNQPLLTGSNSLKLQFASNSSSTDADWEYLGPDGSSDTYYTIPETPINEIHNNKRYARYKVFLTTETATATPKVSDVIFSYTSGCIPPGQVLFQGLSNESYELTVTKSGYTTNSSTINIQNGWQRYTVLMESI